MGERSEARGNSRGTASGGEPNRAGLLRFRSLAVALSFVAHAGVVLSLKSRPLKPDIAASTTEEWSLDEDDSTVTSGAMGQGAPFPDKNGAVAASTTPAKERLRFGADRPFVNGAQNGRGGEASGQRAVFLADRAETKTFVTAPTTDLDRNQEQRVKSGKERRSREDYRATPRPLEMTFVSSGNGVLEKRQEGVERPPLDDTERGIPGADVELPAAGKLLEGTVLERAPDAQQRDAVGALEAPSPISQSGGDPRPAAGRQARPDVPAAAAAVASEARGKTSDTLDSDQAAAALMKNLVQSSTFGSKVDGEGTGGTGGGGALGALGKTGESASGGGAGTPFGVLDWNSRDARSISWFRLLHQKIDPLWKDAFPREALAELRQGTVIFEFTVDADGRITVAWPPAKRSGVDAFDRNVAEVLRKASPVAKPPAVLGAPVRVRAPFRVDNPLVK